MCIPTHKYTSGIWMHHQCTKDKCSELSSHILIILQDIAILAFLNALLTCSFCFTISYYSLSGLISPPRQLYMVP